MEKRNDITNNVMMEMCMQAFCMCMICCAYISDVLSIFKAEPYKT